MKTSESPLSLYTNPVNGFLFCLFLSGLIYDHIKENQKWTCDLIFVYNFFHRQYLLNHQRQRQLMSNITEVN